MSPDAYRQAGILLASAFSVEGIGPTNDRAGRALRHGVIGREPSGGTASEAGGRFVERVLWVPATQEVALEVRAFRRAFVRLTPIQREVLVLHAVHGLRYERIAAVCDCEIGTVKSRMSRARAALKAMLLGEDEPEETSVRARRRPEPRRAGAA